MGDIWHVGRKAIITYLKPFLDLHDDPEIAWQKVRRWKRRYGLPILAQPTDKPYIDPEEFRRWWREYLENRKAEENKKSQ